MSDELQENKSGLPPRLAGLASGLLRYINKAETDFETNDDAETDVSQPEGGSYK